MADTKISAAVAVGSVSAAMEFPLNNAGTGGKASAEQLRDFMRPYFIRADVSRSLSNAGTEQAIFNAPTNGRITLPVGLYRMEALVYVTGMSATSGNMSIDPRGAGTAVCGSWLYHVVGVDNSTPTNAAAQTGCFAITQQTVASALTAGTGTAAGARLRGTFEVTTAGTLIPSLTLVTASAATLAAGSYFMFQPLSTATNATNYGPWD